MPRSYQYTAESKCDRGAEGGPGWAQVSWLPQSGQRECGALSRIIVEFGIGQHRPDIRRNDATESAGNNSGCIVQTPSHIVACGSYSWPAVAGVIL